MSPYLRPLVVAASFVMCAGAAHAQGTPSFKSHCLSTGYGPPEALGDRPGHAISVSQFTCRSEGGPVDGAVSTGTQIFEWNGATGVGESGFGVYRLPGATAVWIMEQFRNELTIVDGKVTGFVATGRGRVSVATGSMSNMAGRKFSYTGRPTGPGQFVIESTLE